jgi:hypothetical protein
MIAARQFVRQLTATGFLIVLVVASGCSGSGAGSTTVQGNVKVQNAPIARAAVTFFPERGRPITTSTDEQGLYTVDLAPGEYRVTVNIGAQLPEGWKEGDPVPPQKAIVPPQFTSRVNTPLRTTVTQTGAEPADFLL